MESFWRRQPQPIARGSGAIAPPEASKFWHACAALVRYLTRVCDAFLQHVVLVDSVLRYLRACGLSSIRSSYLKIDRLPRLQELLIAMRTS